MLTLAVDTTADYGSIALAEVDGCREEVLLHAPQGFSHVLFAEIEALLARQRVALADIDLFAAASGPGSFTGVRVGHSAVKGLAEVLGKRVAAVSNLETLAELGQSDARATVIDARRGEVFGAVYDGSGRQIVPELVAPFSKFVKLVPAGPLEWISTVPQIFQHLLAGTRFEGNPIIPAPRAIAALIARVAISRHKAQDPTAIEANYVRRSDAELLFT